MEVQEAKHRLNILIENQLVRAYRVEQEVGSSAPLRRSVDNFIKCLPKWAEIIPNVNSFVYRTAIKAIDEQQRAHIAYKVGEAQRKRQQRLMKIERQATSKTKKSNER